MSLPLEGRRIAVPETRELDLLVGMLEGHGAEAIRCPMAGIEDSPDAAIVNAWLGRCIAGALDDLVLYTGEGVRRLTAAAERLGSKEVFVTSLVDVRKITRGPKPVRALRQLGLKSDLPAVAPTTEGLIATLDGEDLNGHTVGVQLYPGAGERPAQLVEFLKSAGSIPDPVTPYVYVPAAADQDVITLIDDIALGRVDAIVFTSAMQVKRLRETAVATDRQDRLLDGLAKTKVAAVGPVVTKEIEKLGATVHIAPQGKFSLKPLVNEIVAKMGASSP